MSNKASYQALGTIVHWIPRIAPTNNGVIVGGSVNTLLTLIRWLPKSVRTTLFCQCEPRPKKYFTELDIYGAELVVHTNPFKPNTVPYGCYFLATSLFYFLWRGRDYAIYHGHSGFAPYALLNGALSLVTNKKIFYTLYCPFSSSNLLVRKLVQWALNRHTRIFAMSHNIAISLEKLGIKKEKICALPPHIDVQRYSKCCDEQRVLTDLGVPHDRPALLFVGNMKASKGLDVLVQSVIHLSKVYRFSFIYTLEYMTKEEELKHDHLAMILDQVKGHISITRLGFIEDMPQLFASVDLIVVPFRDTNGPSDYPLVIMEAMASGVPPVATRVGGIPELIRDFTDGILVNPNDPDALTRGIECLLADEHFRRTLGREAKLRAKSHFSPHNAITKLMEAYADGAS